MIGRSQSQRHFSSKFHHSNHPNRRAHLHESHRTLRDGSFGVALSPGTSCQATIAPSLRDISQQALVSWLQCPNSSPGTSCLANIVLSLWDKKQAEANSKKLNRPNGRARRLEITHLT
jgi:hypothetical protein